MRKEKEKKRDIWGVVITICVILMVLIVVGGNAKNFLRIFDFGGTESTADNREVALDEASESGDVPEDGTIEDKKNPGEADSDSQGSSVESGSSGSGREDGDRTVSVKEEGSENGNVSTEQDSSAGETKTAAVAEQKKQPADSTAAVKSGTDTGKNTSDKSTVDKNTPGKNTADKEPVNQGDTADSGKNPGGISTGDSDEEDEEDQEDEKPETPEVPDEGGDKEPDEGGDEEPDEGGDEEPDEGDDNQDEDNSCQVILSLQDGNAEITEWVIDAEEDRSVDFRAYYAQTTEFLYENGRYVFDENGYLANYFAGWSLAEADPEQIVEDIYVVPEEAESVTLYPVLLEVPEGYLITYGEGRQCFRGYTGEDSAVILFRGIREIGDGALAIDGLLEIRMEEEVPPELGTGVFGEEIPPELRILVSDSENDEILNAYRISWAEVLDPEYGEGTADRLLRSVSAADPEEGDAGQEKPDPEEGTGDEEITVPGEDSGEGDGFSPDDPDGESVTEPGADTGGGEAIAPDGGTVGGETVILPGE